MPVLSASAVPFQLRRVLAREEYRTGSSLDDATRLGLPLWETTLSQLLWFALATDPATRSQLRVRVYSQTEEGTNGADWLWSFSSPSTTTVMPLLVQAKRLRDGRYAINQPAGAVTQAELFSQYSAGERIPAAYVFYNPQSVAAAVSLPCDWETRLCPLGGITIADAHEVASIARGTTAVSLNPTWSYPSPSGLSIAEVAWPLSCGLCCSVHHTWPSGAFPEAIGRALEASGVHGTTLVDQDSSFVVELREAISALRETSAAGAGLDGAFDQGGDAEAHLEGFLERRGVSGLISVEMDPAD